MPSRPASKIAGCKTLVGQTFMHSPQRMHRLRNVFSSAAPGGRKQVGGTVGSWPKPGRHGDARDGRPGRDARQHAAAGKIDRPRPALRPALQARTGPCLSGSDRHIPCTACRRGEKGQWPGPGRPCGTTPRTGRTPCKLGRDAFYQRAAGQQPEQAPGRAEIAAPEPSAPPIPGQR